MQIKYFALISLALTEIYVYPSNNITTYTTATANLLNAQNALSILINGGITNYSNQGVGNIQTTIANNSATQVSMIVFNSSNTQINNIPLAGRSSSYLPIDAATIQLVDAKRKPLTAVTQIKTNTPYSITHINNKWEITELTETASYNYTNTTNIPLIVKITTNNIQIKEEIDPAGIFVQTINPSSPLARKMFLKHGNIATKYNPLVSIEIHANLAGITIPFNAKASYEINITNGQLVCTQTAATGSTLTNKTSWPMFVNTISANNSMKQFTLEDGDRYQSDSSIDQISIAPLIENQNAQYISAKSFSITNNKGVLTF